MLWIKALYKFSPFDNFFYFFYLPIHILVFYSSYLLVHEDVNEPVDGQI